MVPRHYLVVLHPRSGGPFGYVYIRIYITSFSSLTVILFGLTLTLLSTVVILTLLMQILTVMYPFQLTFNRQKIYGV